MKLVIIVGLPGSGKTFVSNTFKNYLIIDDYFQQYYTCQLSQIIIDNPYVLINDPRLCFKNVFINIVAEAKKIVSEKEILYIFFKNETDKCLKNIIKNGNIKNITSDYISNISKKYDLEDLVGLIGGSECTIMNVYQEQK